KQISNHNGQRTTDNGQLFITSSSPALARARVRAVESDARCNDLHLNRHSFLASALGHPARPLPAPAHPIPRPAANFLDALARLLRLGHRIPARHRPRLSAPSAERRTTRADERA